MATRANSTGSRRAARVDGRGSAGDGTSSYDRFKDFHGQRYTGMKVGRSHKWRYDAGEWREKKVTPDRWDFQYAVVKRRAGRAPEGSGAPLGTAYRWYILADQVVTKRDANSYTTEMAGIKFKVAHRRADKDSWSASEAAQRRRVVKLLREMIADIEATEPTARRTAKGDIAAPKSRASSPVRTAGRARAPSRSRVAGKPRKKAARPGTRRPSQAA